MLNVKYDKITIICHFTQNIFKFYICIKSVLNYTDISKNFNINSQLILTQTQQNKFHKFK